MENKKSKTYCSDKTWLESSSVEQFNRVMSLEGIVEGYAFPDLHPGRGIPVGAAFLSKELIYPSLIGNDIGCGMTLFATDVPIRKLKIDKLLRKIGDDPEGMIRQTSLASLLELEVDSENFRPYIFNVPDPLGTIGHGNHFIEIQSVEKVLDEDSFKSLGIQKETALILIHSGSRGYGESLWKGFASIHGDAGVPFNSPEGENYLAIHEQLIKWSRFNRQLIGNAIGRLLSCGVKEICDSVHNSIRPCGNDFFIHRKGASEIETLGQPIVVAGSRGTLSYLVKPSKETESSLNSISHGCGRKWDRQSSRTRVREKHPDVSTLLQTSLGTKVICPEKELLYEEAPESYKSIDDVIADLSSFNLAHPILSLRPVVNIKP